MKIVPGTLCNQKSNQERLADEVLRDLYPNKGRYVSAFNIHTLMELVREGWWPREYADRSARDDIKGSPTANRA